MGMKYIHARVETIFWVWKYNYIEYVLQLLSFNRTGSSSSFFIAYLSFPEYIPDPGPGECSAAINQKWFFSLEECDPTKRAGNRSYVKMDAFSNITYEEYSGGVRFQETQKFRQPLLWAFLAAISVVSILVAALEAGADIPVGNNPAPGIVLILIVVIFGILLPLFFYLLAFTVEVKKDGIYYRFYPVQITFRHIPWNELSCAKSVTYRPLADYGGWGIRYGRNGMAYNVSGSEGVMMIKKDGKKLLLGSQHAVKLANEIHKAGNIPECGE